MKMLDNAEVKTLLEKHLDIHYEALKVKVYGKDVVHPDWDKFKA